MIFRLFLVVVVLFFVGCSIDFERDWDQIDDDMVRPISYKFINPETAPGDTAELEILFVGKPITLSDISEWRVSWDFYTDDYGNMAPRGETALKLIGAPTIREENSGQVVNVKFQVPADILHKASVLPDDFGDVIKNPAIGDIGQLGNILGDLPFKNKTDVLNLLETFANMPLAAKQAIPHSQGAMINGLAQMFSSRYEVYMDFNNGTPRTKLRNTARWHRKLEGIPGIYINKNPEVRFNEWKVWAMNEADAYNFDKSKSTEVSRSGDTINIPVSGSKTIFMEIWASPKDSIITIQKALTTQIADVEDYSFYTFAHGKKLYDGLMIGGEPTSDGTSGDANGYGLLKLTVDGMQVGDTGFIWSVISDDYPGVANHPQGISTIGFPVKFVE